MAVSGNITVVAAHGAWADGSSWKDVILRLQEVGVRVIAVPIPLTSLGDDVAAVKRIMARTTGPLILAAHAYAGAVIGAVNDDRVKALVYISALAPDEGETVAQVFDRDESIPSRPNSHRIQTVSSGCRTTASKMLLRKMLRQTKSRYREPCSGQSP